MLKRPQKREGPQEQLVKELARVVYSILQRAESDEVIALAQQELASKLSLGGKIPEVQELRRQLTEREHLDDIVQIVTSGGFHIEILNHKDQYSTAIFRNFIPALVEYIDRKPLGGEIDHAIYFPELERSEYQSSRFPKFNDLEKINRKGTTWTFSLEGQKFSIQPLQRIEQISTFYNSESVFCYHDPYRNVAQLYFYAAHRGARLLGIWDEKGEPQGIIPLLAMRLRSNGKKLPFLYLEAPMLKNLVKKDREVRSPYSPATENGLIEAILDILPVYTAMQEGQFYLLIGDCRKIGNYGDFIYRFVDAAVARFSSPEKPNGLMDLESVINGERRKVVRAARDTEVQLELPEDRELHHYLTKCGYRYSRILMHSQAFLADKEREKTNQLGDWGEMLGISPVIPSPKFHRYFMDTLQ